MFLPELPANQSFIQGVVPEVIAAVMDLLDGDDMIRLRHASRLCESWVATTIHIRSRKLFSHTATDYDDLLLTLDDNDAVIGGAGAVYILFPSDSVPKHFHIYVPRARYHHVVTWFVHRAGFTGELKKPDAKAGQVFPEGVASISRLRKGNLTIDAIQSVNQSPLYPIASSLHTGYFNYVSTRWYGSAYPSLTRHRRALLNPARLEFYLDVPAYDLEERDAWRKDGWTVDVEWRVWAPGGICLGVNSVGCACASRAFGDHHSFRGTSMSVRGRTGRTTSVVDTLTVLWWRGGYVCGPTCHGGNATITPGLRLCLRRILR